MLTIFGITIGVLALVVMGSMAEKINLMVSGGTKYYSDKVTVAADERQACSPAARCRYGKLDAIKAVPGVAEVSGRASAPCSTPTPRCRSACPPSIERQRHARRRSWRASRSPTPRVET